MSKNDRLIITVALTLLILFLLNYFVTLPSITSYNENMVKVEELDTQLQELQADIAQGAELEAAIVEVDANIAAFDIDQYHDENYSVHNYFVDAAETFTLEVSSLSMSNVASAGATLSSSGSEVIAEHPLISGFMTVEEIEAVPSYYEIVSQSTSISIAGTPEQIFSYVGAMAEDQAYISLPNLSLSDFLNNDQTVETALQFVEYAYRVAPVDLSVEVTLSE